MASKPSKPKVMIRKTTQVQPELHSLLRLSHQVNRVKSELKQADTNKALELAKDKILESPNTNKTFKKSVAKKVEFANSEKIFNQLTSLDLSEATEKNYKPVKNVKIAGKRDVEPVLSDFHQPFKGEAIPMTASSKNVTAKIEAEFFREDPNWKQNFLANCRKIQDEFDF